MAAPKYAASWSAAEPVPPEPPSTSTLGARGAPAAVLPQGAPAYQVKALYTVSATSGVCGYGREKSEVTGLRDIAHHHGKLKVTAGDGGQGVQF